MGVLRVVGLTFSQKCKIRISTGKGSQITRFFCIVFGKSIQNSIVSEFLNGELRGKSAGSHSFRFFKSNKKSVSARKTG